MKLFCSSLDKGELFGWGNSEYAQFRAVTDEMQINVPRHLKYDSLKDKKIIDIACGGTTCAVLDGKLFLFIRNFFSFLEHFKQI